MRISDWSSDVCSSDLRRFRSSSPANGTGNPHGSGSPHLGIRARCVESASSLFARHEREDGADRMRAAPAGSWRLHHLQMQRTLRLGFRSEEHTSELQSLMRISYAVFCF